jgi:mannose-6-phosphate isomerase-like protein (cupin superfamily)
VASPDGVVGLDDKFSKVAGFWSPHIVAEFNGLHVKLARVHGEFVWHTHEETDEVFLVNKGSVEIQMRDRPAVRLGSGDLFVVPAGVEHRPVAEEECELLLIEPANTPNTGNEDTAADEPWI